MTFCYEKKPNKSQKSPKILDFHENSLYFQLIFTTFILKIPALNISYISAENQKIRLFLILCSTNYTGFASLNINRAAP